MPTCVMTDQTRGMDYSHLLYKRDRLLSQRRIRLQVATWIQETIGACFISSGPENPLSFSQEEGAQS